MRFTPGFQVRSAVLLPGRKAGLRAAFLLGALLLGVSQAGSRSTDISSGDYRAKAIFLSRFLHLVEWPAESFASSSAPIVICVFGEFHFGTSLAEALRGNTAQGHPLEARWVRQEADLNACHVLFISGVEKSRYEKLLNGLRANSILTVGESREFLDSGGVLYLYLENEKLRFDVNLDRAHQARLKISSHALLLARRILPRRNSAQP
jgi:hypothetical protein